MGTPEIDMEELLLQKRYHKITLIVLVQVKALVAFLQLNKLIRRTEQWN